MLIYKMKKIVTRGRDTSLYKLYRVLQTHRVGFLRRFGLTFRVLRTSVTCTLDSHSKTPPSGLDLAQSVERSFMQSL